MVKESESCKASSYQGVHTMGWGKRFLVANPSQLFISIYSMISWEFQSSLVIGSISEVVGDYKSYLSNNSAVGIEFWVWLQKKKRLQGCMVS